MAREVREVRSVGGVAEVEGLVWCAYAHILAGVKRTNLFLTDKQREKAIAFGNAHGMSMAEVIRKLIDDHLPEVGRKSNKKPRTGA